MRRLSAVLLLASALPLTACTGLVAGAPVQASSTVPVKSDSAWARARRAVAAEVMTIEKADSISGLLIARRYPKTTAADNALERCHVLVHLNLMPSGDGTDLKWETMWVAPAAMASTQPPVCEDEREGVQSRIQSTISPQ